MPAPRPVPSSSPRGACGWPPPRSACTPSRSAPSSPRRSASIPGASRSPSTVRTSNGAPTWTGPRPGPGSDSTPTPSRSSRSGSCSRTRASTARYRAFAGLGEHGCRLEIVGSLRLEDNEFVAYVDELRDLTDATPGATLHEEYVSDAEFDVWLVAADVLVLPYRLIWSSGVCERAALYDRPVIASRTGGLADQVTTNATLVEDDAELAAAMRSVAGFEVPVRASGGLAHERPRRGHGRDPGPGRTSASELDAHRDVGDRTAQGQHDRADRTAPPHLAARDARGPLRASWRLGDEEGGPPDHRMGGRPDHRPAEPAPAGHDRRARRRADTPEGRTGRLTDRADHSRSGGIRGLDRLDRIPGFR